MQYTRCKGVKARTMEKHRENEREKSAFAVSAKEKFREFDSMFWHHTVHKIFIIQKRRNVSKINKSS